MSGNCSINTEKNPPSQKKPKHQMKYCHPEAAMAAAHAAARVSREVDRTYRILDSEKEQAVPRIFRHELVLGKILGKGGFSNVFEIIELDLSEVEIDETKPLDETIKYQIRARDFLSQYCVREKSDNARYAAKFLKLSTMADARKFKIGAADLAVEARLLASLDHPNIVKMRGVAAEGVAGFASGLEGGYFIIMDRLFDTLEVRIGAWKEMERRQQQGSGHGVLLGKLADIGGRKRRNFLATRLNVAFDIAGALKYLHAHNIIFRDLKPENVGFDVRGDVKIFDFGLSKEVDTSTKLADGTYKLSGNTGSLRYMAPEVAMSEPYNFTADSYSFGTILYEMMSMEKPYDGFDSKMHARLVVRGGHRPNVPKSWPVPLKILVKRSWSENLWERPSMRNIYDSLRLLITKLRNGNGNGLEHVKRRSTHVLELPSRKCLEEAARSVSEQVSQSARRRTSQAALAA